ncbi:MAG: PD40 domain-containing protein [Myxococcaceae bacterium]|nr:PD40 domain-containing protein [Myxococcaceae bacterium]
MRRALLLFTLACSSAARAEDFTVVFVNGIQNDIYQAKSAVVHLHRVLKASQNHPGTAARTFEVTSVYNPTGWYGDGEAFADLVELYLLKTQEELFGDDFRKIMVPFNASASIDVAAATRVAAFASDLTPGVTSLEADGDVTDAHLRGTQAAIRRLAEAMSGCRPVIVVPHSQGNLLTNLAWARVASEFPERALKKVRVVNVANTAEFSVNNLNHTHRGDRALFAPVIGLETLGAAPLSWSRTTPRCPNDMTCNFTIALASFDASADTVDDATRHGFVEIYLSNATVPVTVGNLGVTFTPGKTRFVDRFEDFVYAAADSIDDQARGSMPATPGRYTAFVSYATNLTGGLDGGPNIFVNDAMTGATSLVSVAFNGLPPQGRSFAPSVSADGQRVAFVSEAPNLVSGDTNGVDDIFVFDRSDLSTRRVSVATGGSQANGRSSAPIISADGRAVAFVSVATNLVDDDTNAKRDVFVHDLIFNRTVRASVSSQGAQGNGDSLAPSLSANGCRVAFESGSVWDGVFGAHVYVHDRDTLETLRASRSVDQQPGNNGSRSASLSADGLRVAFTSLATNLVPGDTEGFEDVFVKNLVSEEVVRASVSTAGVAGNMDTTTPPSLSGDARTVAFVSGASNLVAGDTRGELDLFVRDLDAGTTTRHSLNPDGTEPGIGVSGRPGISRDGRYVCFVSQHNRFVPMDENNSADVFVRDVVSGTTRRASAGALVESDGYSQECALSP